MTYERSLEQENDKYFEVEQQFSITKYQFAALVKHFEKVLDKIKLDKTLSRIAMEFTKLLNIFKACFAESERKTNKIFELKTLKILASQNSQNVDFQQNTIQNLKDTINFLQKDLDTVNEQKRELLNQVKNLNKNVETEEKATEIFFDCLETQGNKETNLQAVGDERITIKNIDNGKSYPVNEQILIIKPKEVTDTKILKNDLEILVADLKIARKHITALKKEINSKDLVIKESNDDISISKTKLTKVQRQVVEKEKSIEIALNNCKAEREKYKKKFQNAFEDLQSALDINAKMTKDIELKETLIENFKGRTETLIFEKESITKKANALEEVVAKSQAKIEASEQKITFLKTEVQKLQNETPVVRTVVDTPLIQKEKSDIATQENLVENLRNQIALREKSLLQAVHELKMTVENMRTIKKDLNTMTKNKVSLECGVQEMKKKLKDKNEDLKLLKERLLHDKKNVDEIKKELYIWVKKYKKAVEKENKFLDLYNQKKFENSELKKEMVILGKRQEYLVKILKEKDKQMEKLVKWSQNKGENIFRIPSK